MVSKGAAGRAGSFAGASASASGEAGTVISGVLTIDVRASLTCDLRRSGIRSLVNSATFIGDSVETGSRPIRSRTDSPVLISGVLGTVGISSSFCRSRCIRAPTDSPVVISSAFTVTSTGRSSSLAFSRCNREPTDSPVTISSALTFTGIVFSGARRSFIASSAASSSATPITSPVSS